MPETKKFLDGNGLKFGLEYLFENMPDTDSFAAREDVNAIEELIPTQAAPNNQLADKDFVNSTVTHMAAHFVSYDAMGNSFPTRAALTNATLVYHQGQSYTPTEHDYTSVTADETHDGQQWRYGYDGVVWYAQYKVNPEPFTVAQQAAINSDITQELTGKLSVLPDNTTLQEILAEKYSPTNTPSPEDIGAFPANGIRFEGETLIIL